MRRLFALIAAASALLPAAADAQTATSLNTNNNSAAATSSGAATNTQSILANPQTQAIGGDVNNTIIQPAFGQPSFNRIGRNEVQCQGPSLGFSGGVYPNDQDFFNQSNFEPQFSVSLTFPLGGSQAYCRGVAAKIEELKAIEVNLSKISASASIIKTCLEMTKQGLDLESLDPVAVGVNFKQLCASVKTVAQSNGPVLQQFVPPPPGPSSSRPQSRPAKRSGAALLKPIGGAPAANGR